MIMLGKKTKDVNFVNKEKDILRKIIKIVFLSF